MHEQRNQFTFYRSWFEAIETLEPEDQRQALLALCDYALNGNLRDLTGAASTVVILAKPVLDTARKRAEAGSLGGKAVRKQNASKPEASNSTRTRTSNRTSTSTSTNVDIREEALARLSPPLREAMEKWLCYKAERKEAYQSTGLDALIDRTVQTASRHGEQQAVEAIYNAMASGYKGIPFDRIVTTPQNSGIQYSEKAREDIRRFMAGEMD